ncbi:hypothetical protein [Deinococcus sp. RM]|uniref:hypothetical protein n=1 Tax=Deinococcus sp. RM TaxID=2316359 RepID=UPI0011C241B4|nr:hypothetical protein [Deinococcus sp. RM]
MTDTQLLPLSDRPVGFPLRLYRALRVLPCSRCERPIPTGALLTRSADRAASKAGYVYRHCLHCRPVPGFTPSGPLPPAAPVGGVLELWVVLRGTGRAPWWGAVLVRAGRVIGASGAALSPQSRLMTALRAARAWAAPYGPVQVYSQRPLGPRRKPGFQVTVRQEGHEHFTLARRTVQALRDGRTPDLPAGLLVRPPVPPPPPPLGRVLAYVDYSGSDAPRAYAWGAVFCDQVTGETHRASGPLSVGGEARAIKAALAWLAGVWGEQTVTVFNDDRTVHVDAQLRGVDVRYLPRTSPLIRPAHDLARAARRQLLGRP